MTPPRRLRKGDRVRGGKSVHGTIVRWNRYLRCFVVRWDHATWESYEWRKGLRLLPRKKKERRR